MTLLFMHGADDGTLDHYTQVIENTTGLATMDIVSGGRTGNRVRLVQSTSAKGYMMRRLGAAHAKLVVGGYVKFGTFEQITYFIALGDNGATEHIRILSPFNSSNLEIRRGGTGGTLLATISGFFSGVSDGGSCYVEMEVTLHDSTGEVKVYKNGTQVGSTFTGDTKNGGTNATLDAFGFGGAQNWPTTFYYEDIYALNGAGSVNNAQLGDRSVQTIYPSGNGNSSQWTGSDGNSTDNYLLVDETTPNVSDYVTSSTLNHVDTYAHGNLTGSGSVDGVMVSAYAQRAGGSDGAIETVARYSGSQVYGPEQIVGSTAASLSAVFETAPDAATWNFTKVDASEFGVRNADPA